MTDSTRLQLIFVLLQIGDLLTTLIAFAMGGYEANPLVSRFLVLGTVQGLLFAKVVALTVGLVIVMRRKFRFLRIANIVYSGIVIWNSFLIVATAVSRR